jgi:hypothetical protein
MITVFNCVNKWFKVNLLSINVNKIHYIQFKTKNKPKTNIHITCNDNLITSLTNIKFLGIYINDSINWSCHIEYIIPKLSSACYIMRSIKPFMSLNTLKIIYCSYFNMMISYSLPFWGNLPHSIKRFRIQKKIIRIIMRCKSRTSCRNLSRRLEILPFVSQYIFSLMLFVVENKNLFILNSENHTTNTRKSNNFHQPITTLTMYQVAVYYMGSIKVFNNLSSYIKEAI